MLQKICKSYYDKHWMETFGLLTLRDVESMYANQQRCCALCHALLSKETGCVIDHSHSCPICSGWAEHTAGNPDDNEWFRQQGLIMYYACGQCTRGLLCRKCNGLLGAIEKRGCGISRTQAARGITKQMVEDYLSKPFIVPSGTDSYIKERTDAVYCSHGGPENQ
jgi:hypothetical protein